MDEELLYAIDEKARSVDLLEKGRELLSPQDPERFVVPDLAAQLSELEGREDLDAEEKIKLREEIYRSYAVKNERIHNVQALLKAYSLFEKDVEYVVQDGKVMIVDEFTGRLMPGRRYSDGLHQAIEAKEGVQIEGETQTLATITLQNFFRMYEKLAGMTGTAETEAREFWEIYKLDVSVIPTHQPVHREDLDDVDLSHQAREVQRRDRRDRGIAHARASRCWSARSASRSASCCRACSSGAASSTTC